MASNKKFGSLCKMEHYDAVTNYWSALHAREYLSRGPQYRCKPAQPDVNHKSHDKLSLTSVKGTPARLNGNLLPSLFLAR